MQIEWGERGCRSSRESSRAVEEEPAHLCKDESMAEVSLGGDRKKMSGGHENTLRQDALKRADSAVCRRVISCSRGHYHRTEQALAHYIDLARIEDGRKHSCGYQACQSGPVLLRCATSAASIATRGRFASGKVVAKSRVQEIVHFLAQLHEKLVWLLLHLSSDQKYSRQVLRRDL
jgi:hypothetical protein